MQTRCSRRPQKYREWLAQYPYSAHPARSERLAVSRDRPHSTGVESTTHTSSVHTAVSAARARMQCRIIGLHIQCGGEGIQVCLHKPILGALASSPQSSLGIDHLVSRSSRHLSRRAARLSGIGPETPLLPVPTYCLCCSLAMQGQPDTAKS